MEKNVILQQSKSTGARSLSNTCATHWKMLKKMATAPIEWFRCYYSSVQEREVSTKQTLHYLHAQLAFILTVFVSYDSLLVFFGMLLWTAIAMLACKEANSDAK